MGDGTLKRIYKKRFTGELNLEGKGRLTKFLCDPETKVVYRHTLDRYCPNGKICKLIESKIVQSDGKIVEIL